MKREGCVGSARIVGGKHSIPIDCLNVHVVDTARAVGGRMLSWLRCVGVRVPGDRANYTAPPRDSDGCRTQLGYSTFSIFLSLGRLVVL